jgi:hypothetical protein
VPGPPASHTAGDGFDLEVAIERPDGRITLRFTQGVMAGRCVTAFPDEQCTLADDPPLTPRQKADRLLTSLLDSEQQLSWRATKRFRLDTPYGVLELGTIHNMPYWPRRERRQLNLCVVPTGDLARLPEADIWTNLLLVLRAEPERFFAVANWRRAGESQWYRPPPPGLEKLGSRSFTSTA